MADSKLRDENYYLVYGWMVNRLKLKGVKLNIYAIIYGFSQDGENEYTGTLQYLCDLCGGVSRSTISKALKELVDEKLILRREETISNVIFARYRANLNLVE